MKNYKHVITSIEKLDSITCDRCKKTFEDRMDIQEFTCLGDTGGYSSAWGDMTTWSIDLCSECSVKMFEKYATITPDGVFKI